MSSFTQRVYSAVIVKSINSNFNADFTHSPRTLPDGVVYSTDKALKYAVKDFLRKQNQNIIFYVQRNDSKELRPLTLDKTYELLFPSSKEKSGDKENRILVLKNLLSCLDIRLFGATFAGKIGNVSIHGPVQINHGVNRFPENEIYSEQIKAPFAGSDGDSMTTIGSQTNLREGHYVFHISINPKNIAEYASIAGSEGLSESDVLTLKSALCYSVTALDSSRKIGSENEGLVWVTMKSGSTKHLPSFTELIDIKRGAGDLRILDCSRLESVLEAVKSDIESIEFWYNPINTELIGLASAAKFHLISGHKM